MDARILLAIGNEMLATGLEALLVREPGIRSVVATRDMAGALEVLASAKIDVAVLDVALSGPAGFTAIEPGRRLRMPAGWVALTDRPTRVEIEEIMRARAAGIVSTASSARALADAIQRVHGGGCYVATEVMSTLVDGPVGGGVPLGPDVASLTVREREVLRSIAEGLSSREIAGQLGVSTRTIETHRAHLMAKLDLRKTAALVRYAVRKGLVAA